MMNTNSEPTLKYNQLSIDCWTIVIEHINKISSSVIDKNKAIQDLLKLSMVCKTTREALETYYRDKKRIIYKFSEGSLTETTIELRDQIMPIPSWMELKFYYKYIDQDVIGEDIVWIAEKLKGNLVAFSIAESHYPKPNFIKTIFSSKIFRENIEELKLSTPLFDPTEFESDQAFNFPKLKNLSISHKGRGAPFSISFLKTAHIPSLKYLKLNMKAIETSKYGLTGLVFPKVEFLCLFCGEVESLSSLKSLSFPRLKTLKLVLCPSDISDLERFQTISKLIIGVSKRFKDVEQLSKMKNLKHLKINSSTSNLINIELVHQMKLRSLSIHQREDSSNPHIKPFLEHLNIFSEEGCPEHTIIKSFKEIQDPVFDPVFDHN